MKAEKKCNAIVFGLTSNHIFAVACVMMDLKRIASSYIDEVVIIHDGIVLEDQKLLKSILPTRFIFYDFPLTSERVLYAPFQAQKSVLPTQASVPESIACGAALR